MKKNKIGFTLIEMMTVVAIIILLTTALTFSVSTYMGKAQSVSSAASIHVNNYDASKIQVDALNRASPATPTPAPHFTVKFYDEHNCQIGGTQSIASGEGAVEPDANRTDRYDYILVGWKNAAGATEDYTRVTKDLNLYPNYTIAYHVSFLSVHYPDGNPAEQKVAEGSLVIEPIPSPTPYSDFRGTHTFIGWYNGSQKWVFSNPVDGFGGPCRLIILSAHYN